MQAIILAAGMGKRLKFLTQNNTKCMIKVNGVTLIERMLHQLDKQYLSRIVIVIGYEGEKLVDYISTLDIKTPIQYINNSIYDKTNNIYSLALASEYLLKEDTLLLESDLIFEDSILELLIKDERPTLALVDKYQSWMDGTVVKIDNDDNILEFIPSKKFSFNDIPHYYKTVNIYKFSQTFSSTHYVPFLTAYSKALGNNEYYEQVLRVITMLDNPEIEVKRLDGQLWYEIDDIQDLDIASSMFINNPVKQTELIQNRLGGYWRYPKLIDFSGNCNPFFPPKKLMNEMKANFEFLLCNSPSNITVNSLLVAKFLGFKPEQIAVAPTNKDLISAFKDCTNTKSSNNSYNIVHKHIYDDTFYTSDVLSKKDTILLLDFSKDLNINGLNISVLVSNNTQLVSKIRNVLPEKPLNSFSEFFLQIAEKYKKDFNNSITLLENTKKHFEHELKQIHQINVVPTDNHYILLKISEKNTKEIVTRLLSEHNILVKHIEKDNLIRLSIKAHNDNYKLIKALKDCLN